MPLQSVRDGVQSARLTTGEASNISNTRSTLLPVLAVANAFFSQARLAKGSKFFLGGVSLFLKNWTHPPKTFYPLAANVRIQDISM